MIILGIDPGYERCGFAIIQYKKGNKNILQYGCIKTSAQKIFPERLTEIANDFTTLLEHFQPNIIAIEDLYFAQNVTTGLKVSQVRGVLIYLAHQAGAEILEPSPLVVKQSFTGNGKADKQAMKIMAEKQFRLVGNPLDDTIDAIAVAYWASFQKNSL